MRKIVKLVKELLFKLGLDKSVNFLINSGIVGKIHILLERLDTKSFREFYSMHMKEFEEVERAKTESTAKLKLFVEGLMPFYMLKDFAERIVIQLEREEQSRLFYYIQEKI